jgi:pimeloyl-ACP methyl ester carboxylesterase
MIENNQYTFNNATSPVFKFGKGPKTILVLHGWGSRISSWHQLLDSIDKNQFTTYFLELPGFGDSKHPIKAWDVDTYLSFVKHFASENKIQVDYLLVHSFGARIATKWLVESDNTIKKAIYIGAAGIKPQLSKFKRIVKKVSPKLKKLFNKKAFAPIYIFFQNIIYKLTDSGDYLKVKGAMKQTFVNVIEEDLSDLLPEINRPVLLVWGEEDTYTPLWMGNIMHQKIPDSRINVIPNVRHGLHIQCPEVIVENINEFFN